MRDALSVTSMGQASATLSAATSQHLTAVLGGHSLAEAVLLGALTLLGLIGTEHCMTPPFNKIGVQSVADRLCRTYSTAQKTLCHRSTLFWRRTNGATGIITSPLHYVKENISFFCLIFSEKSLFLQRKSTLNVVVFDRLFSLYMVYLLSLFSDN
jgi:hypothetical protein